MNAARHTKADRTIWLRVRPEGDGVLIAVEDDGPGVPEEFREAIFEPFRQGPTSSPALARHRHRALAGRPLRGAPRRSRVGGGA